MKPTVHLIGIPNTVLSEEFSYSGFTAKATLIPETLAMFGYDVVEYSNEGSETTAGTKVVVLSRAALNAHLTAPDADTKRNDGQANPEFTARLIQEILPRAKKGDFVIHTLGPVVHELVPLLPQCAHVEWGVGYMAPGFGPRRIFESYAWMHYHHGLSRDVNGSDYDFVVPPSCRTKEWPLGKGKGGLIYFGRVCESKGMAVVRAVAEALKETITVYGAGDPSPWKSRYLDFAGHAPSKDRAKIFGNARAVLTPTRYIEPGARVPIEAFLCGTPVIGPDFGCFTEFITPGVNGFRCRSLEDYVRAVEEVQCLEREGIQRAARRHYSISAAASQYDRILTQLHDLWGEGWYALRKGA